jgi:hypothetical protein
MDVNGNEFVFSDSSKAEVFFARANESAFDDVKAAYTAGKRIVGALGGTTTAGNLFQQETPLAFVTFTDNEPTAFTFLFENARPKTASGAGLGSTTRWTVSSSGWAVTTDNVDYAKTAGTANMANSATTATSATTLSSVLPTSKGGTGFSTVDTAPTKDSNKMVTSDGVWNDTPSPIAHYFDSTDTVGVYSSVNRADEVVVRNCGRFRLSTVWLKNFSGRTFKIHNATAAQMEISIEVEAGLKLVITDELKVAKTYDNRSGSSSVETRNQIPLLVGETLRMYVIHTSGSKEVAVFLVGSGRWSLFQPAYDKYRRATGISYYQRLCYARTSGSPGSNGNVHLYDGTNWHNICNLSSSSGTVRIAGLDSGRTSSTPATATDYDYNMNIVTGLTLARNGYMGMLYGYVVPNYSTAARLPTASSDTATSYTQSGKTMANCSQLKLDGFDTDAVGSGHAVFTGSSLLHITLLSGTLTFAIEGDFSVFTQGTQYFFSIPVSFGNLTA